MSLPVVRPTALDTRPDAAESPSDAGRTATAVGVLLAAGRSTRFGSSNKLLVELGGTPMVRRAAEMLVAADVADVAVVVGHEADRVREALDGLAVTFVENPRYADGQSTSVRAGVEAVRGRGEVTPGRNEGGPDRVDAAVFALGDMPFVDPASVTALVDAYEAGVGGALAAAHDGTRGNPVLFDAGYFDALAEVDGDTGGREILLRDGVLVETGDPGVVRDVDAPADLDRSAG